MHLTLYVIPGSHPCETVEAALALKGLSYERVDLLPGLSQFQQLARFGRRTVPGLVVDGYKVVGSPLIMRTLDGVAPDPPLYPSDPDERAAVEEAERWGDEQFQEAARWISVYAIGRHPEVGESFLEGSNVPRFPTAVTAALTSGVFRVELRVLGPGVDGTARWLRELPGLLDHADQLIAAGTIGGQTLNAADLQVGASIALLARLEDLRPAIEGRPCGELARRAFPRYPGSIPRNSLPAEWLRAISAPSQAGPVTSAA
jgi:glutathione S-transferase